MKNIQEIIGYKFKDINILNNALCHSSYANENKKNIKNNERLEFLGDSVLSICVSDYIYNNFKDLPEGDLTRIRAAVVCEKALFQIAVKNDIGQFIKLGKGEEMTGGRTRPSILADCIEAIIAAIYLDGGFKSARAFVMRNLEEDMLKYKNCETEDYKTKLQEIIQQNPEEVVEYNVTKESGPDHDKFFEVEVKINNNSVAKGTGKSKKEAEQEAAKDLLHLMGEL
ncbi:MAG: ribonuclease III [Oscillospiraceae bacterium]